MPRLLSGAQSSNPRPPRQHDIEKHEIRKRSWLATSMASTTVGHTLDVVALVRPVITQDTRKRTIVLNHENAPLHRQTPRYLNATGILTAYRGADVDFASRIASDPPCSTAMRCAMVRSEATSARDAHFCRATNFCVTIPQLGSADPNASIVDLEHDFPSIEPCRNSQLTAIQRITIWHCQSDCSAARPIADRSGRNRWKRLGARRLRRGTRAPRGAGRSLGAIHLTTSLTSSAISREYACLVTSVMAGVPQEVFKQPRQALRRFDTRFPA